MTAMPNIPNDSDERFSLLELDLPSDTRTAPRAPAPEPAPAPLPTVNPIGARADAPRSVMPRAVVSPAPAPQPAAPDTRLRAGHMVAGAVAEGHGVLVGFNGRGALTHKRLIATLVDAGFPENWAPTLISAHRHAGRAVSILNQNGYVVRADRTKSQRRNVKKNAEDLAIESGLRAQIAAGGEVGANAAAILRDRQIETGELATWQGRWFVMSTGRASKIGEAAGEIVMIATLTENGALELQCANEDLKQRVRTDFETRFENEEHAASDVSEWLKSTLVSKFRAAKLGGNWYVKRQHAANAERLLTAFAAIWGENFLLPALPVASSDQLLAGLSNSFAREVDEVLTEYRMRKADAVEEKKEISSRVSLSILAKLRELMERCVGFAALLGTERIASLRAQIVAASEEIESTVDGMSLRFGAIFDELARDAR
jgi:hypothetical protein